MKETLAATRYAKAIFVYALENNQLESLAKDMKRLEALFNENDAVDKVLNNPLLPSEKKLNLIHSLLLNNSESTSKLLDLLSNNNRLPLLEETGAQYLKLYIQEKGEVKALVTSAIPLSVELKKKVLKKAGSLVNQKVHIENRIDPSILGGFILKIGDMQYDASVLNHLKAIKTKLLKSNTT